MIKFTISTIFMILLVLGSFRSTEQADNSTAPTPGSIGDTTEVSTSGPTDATRQPALTAADSCSNVTLKSDCCSTLISETENCSFCAAGSENGNCSSQCEEGAMDTCEAPPADPCASITEKEACCKAEGGKCLFCEENAKPGVCSSSNCTVPAADTCGAAPPVVDCATHTDVETCCKAENCAFCQNETMENGTCSSETCPQGIDNMCAVPSTTEPPAPPGTTNSSGTTTPTTPSSSDSGGSGGQKFDAPSFIGGIVLCGGLVAILFFGLKFYKARKEQNYHTL